MTAEEIAELSRLIYVRNTQSISADEHSKMMILLHKAIKELKISAGKESK